MVRLGLLHGFWLRRIESSPAADPDFNNNVQLLLYKITGITEIEKFCIMDSAAYTHTPCTTMSDYFVDQKLTYPYIHAVCYFVQDLHLCNTYIHTYIQGSISMVADSLERDARSGSPHDEISWQLRRGAMEWYLFMAEYMHQCGALWSPITVAMYCYGVIIVTSYFVYGILTAFSSNESSEFVVVFIAILLSWYFCFSGFRLWAWPVQMRPSHQWCTCSRTPAVMTSRWWVSKWWVRLQWFLDNYY